MGYLVGAASIALVLPVCKLDREYWAFLADRAVMAALAYAIVMTSAFNYALSAYANKHSSPTLVTAFFPLQVVFAALLQVLVLGEWPSATQVAGAAAIVVALFCVVASLAYDDARPGGVPKDGTEDGTRGTGDE